MPQHNLYDEKSTRDEDFNFGSESNLRHSLTLMPAGLEVVSNRQSNIQAPGSDKELSPVETRGDKQIYSPAQASMLSDKEAIWPSNDAANVKKEVAGLHLDESVTPSKVQRETRTICGMRAKVFWISLALMIVVFLVGIGLGMGLHDWKSDDNDDVAASNSTMEPSTSSTLASSQTAIERYGVM